MDHGCEAGIGLVRAQGNTAEVFQIAEEILDQMPPFVHYLVDLQWFFALGPLGNADQRAALVHFVDDPVCIEGLVRQQGLEFQPPDQRFDADGIVTISGQKHEPHQIAERVCERQNLGCPTAFGLAYSLTLSPPFAPCAAR